MKSIKCTIALLIGLSFSVMCNAQNEEFFIEEESPVIKTEKVDSTKTLEEKKINLVKENQEEFLIEEEPPVINNEKVDSMQAFAEKQINLVKENQQNQIEEIEEYQLAPNQDDELKKKLKEKEKEIENLKGRVAADSAFKELLIKKVAEAENNVNPPVVVNNKDNTKKEKTNPVKLEKKETKKVSLPKKGTLDINEETKTIRVRKSDLEAKKDEIKKLEGRGYKLDEPLDR